MKNLTAIALASILGLGVVSAAQAQEFGGVPNIDRDVAPVTVQTGRSAFQASAGQPQAPASDWTADQLEGLLSTHAGQ